MLSAAFINAQSMSPLFAWFSAITNAAAAPAPDTWAEISQFRAAFLMVSLFIFITAVYCCYLYFSCTDGFCMPCDRYRPPPATIATKSSSCYGHSRC